jgi:hypothetical protein
MSKTGGFLKGLIFKEDGTVPAPATDAKGKTTAPVAAPATAPTVTVQGVADNKFIDMLEGVIEQSNIPGQDYFEFKQSVENMKQIAVDEKTKFQMAFSVLSLQGCKKDVLLTSIDNYIGIIQKEKTNFDAEMKSAYASKVQSKADQATNAKKELETLTKKLSELNASILTLSQEAQQEEMKIRATEANFKASADVIISEMVSDKEKINSYLT